MVEMQTRWMLWLEQDAALKLLSGIPRRWLEDGKTITLDHVASHFGPLDVKVMSHVAEGVIQASVKLYDLTRLPDSVVIRLPHPEGCKAICTQGGAYDPITETVTITPFGGEATVAVTFEGL